VAGENAFSRFWQSGQDRFGRQSSNSQSRTYALAEIVEALLLRQKNKAITQTQYCKGGSCAQSQVLAKFFRNGELTLFADPGGC
jgi:hypothetical protein